MSGEAEQRFQLAARLGESRGDGFEEFIREFENLPVTTKDERMTAAFIRNVAVAIVETARSFDLEAETAEDSFDILAAAYAACGYALPCMAVAAIKPEGVREVLTYMKTYLDGMYEHIVGVLEAEAKEGADK